MCDTYKRCPCILYVSNISANDLCLICLGLLVRNYSFMLCSSIKQTAFQLAYFRVYKTNTKKPNTPKYTHPFPQTEQKQSPFLNADSFSSERSKVNESIHGSRCKSYIDRSMWCECHVFPFLFWILCHWVIAEMLTVESWGSRENFHWGVGVQGPSASQISSWLAPCSTECPRSFMSTFLLWETHVWP